MLIKKCPSKRPSKCPSKPISPLLTPKWDVSCYVFSNDQARHNLFWNIDFLAINLSERYLPSRT